MVTYAHVVLEDVGSHADGNDVVDDELAEARQEVATTIQQLADLT